MTARDRSNTIKQWFVVHTKPKQEFSAEQQLRRQGYEVYCPRMLNEKRRRGHWSKHIEPLFPRYLFVRLAEGLDNFSPIRSTIGVCDIVRIGRIPKPVPEEVIAAIYAREDQASGVVISLSPWKEGMAIELTDGPFAGFQGIFKAICSNERVLVLLRLLGQNNEILVAQDIIVPA